LRYAEPQDCRHLLHCPRHLHCKAASNLIRKTPPEHSIAGIVLACVSLIAKVRFGVVEAVNGNIRRLINRGRGYKNLRYLLLKVKRMAVTNVEFIAVQREENRVK
jgi:hypothetical protein